MPYHDSLKIIFDLYIFDSWDGNSQSPVFTPADYWGLNVNAAPVIHTTFANNNQTQSYPSDFPNFNPAETGAFSNTLPILYFTGSWPSGNSSLYKINKALVNNSTSAIVDFYAHNLNFGLQDESWGINNVQVYLYSNNFTNNTIWSTGDTTASITVSPSQTTTYYVTQTIDGVSCTDCVTITVLDTSLTVMSITTCDTYTWAVNGATYIAS